MSQSTNDIFHNLEGKWSIKRILGAVGTAEGEASFIQTGNSNVFSYQEKLEITFTGYEKQTGHQEYKFIYDVERDSISKYNSSDNFMYQLKFSGNKANGEYDCTPDKYIATYMFLSDNKFFLIYKVTGPAKNYSIVTEFEKITEAEVGGASLDSSLVD